LDYFFQDLRPKMPHTVRVTSLLSTCLKDLIIRDTNGELGSSVSIVSDYGLDDRSIEVRCPAEANGFFSSLCVQTGSGAHPASFTMGTGGHFPGVKARPGS
jgi:hypothetical protein